MRSAGGVEKTRGIRDLTSWARAHSLWFLRAHSGCCADEVFLAKGCRYDLERFGCREVTDPRAADLLVVSGAVNQKLSPHLRGLYESMLEPRYVLAVGACACTGGLFAGGGKNPPVVQVEEIIPVDVFIPGCPPRPEAVMNGLIALQEKVARGG